MDIAVCACGGGKSGSARGNKPSMLKPCLKFIDAERKRFVKGQLIE
jgi:hypothetical protein